MGDDLYSESEFPLLYSMSHDSEEKVAENQWRKKVGKKAELYAYEKNPEIQNEMLDQGNSCSFTDESNDHDKGKDNHDQAVHNEVKEFFGNFGGPRPGCARLPPPPPPFPPPSYRYGQYPLVYPYSPAYRITKPPWPYPYNFYEKKEPPIGNSVFHSFRNDNVNACSIMHLGETVNIQLNLNN
ncbi:heavy metal-associated isoprenylated plant protein 42-like [Durio zibethinus]|uniref:Heavy metal-associated isoprenylated plant protein 42-like n=1 Tax=Durio zibethinus TaxID=66656 RepID=A0A6P6AXP0_DURZI|nr:heavy metal-associated isoprenylated plant protein 42-like [Durio zibethinus]